MGRKMKMKEPEKGCPVTDAEPLAADNFIHKKVKVMPGNSFEKSQAKPSLLLHSCCGPCSTSVVERLANEFDITVYFYNPCITDEEEYRLRRDNQIKFIQKYNENNPGKNIAIKEGPYNPGAFLRLTEGHGADPEGGDRCTLCFRQRLEKTAQEAGFSGYDYFGTTLTVSPHKNYYLISELGREIAVKYGLSFLDRNFKKQNGFVRSIEMSKEYDLYRQDYCGCLYSKR